MQYSQELIDGFKREFPDEVALQDYLQWQMETEEAIMAVYRFLEKHCELMTSEEVIEAFQNNQAHLVRERAEKVYRYKKLWREFCAVNDKFLDDYFRVPGC